MHYELHYLPFAGTDADGNPEPEREMGHKLDLDDHTPTQDEFDALWIKQTEGDLEGIDGHSDQEILSALWDLYNRSANGYHQEMDDKEMRSLSKNDIVVVDGTAYLCREMGWEELAHL